jgi:hypothetical protein
MLVLRDLVLQEELLHALWPEELLAVHQCKPTYVCYTYATAVVLCCLL